MTYGEDIRFALMLSGYFGADYLGTQAAEGIDWIWAHRTNDMQALGVRKNENSRTILSAEGYL